MKASVFPAAVISLLWSCDSRHQIGALQSENILISQQSKQTITKSKFLLPPFVWCEQRQLWAFSSPQSECSYVVGVELRSPAEDMEPWVTVRESLTVVVKSFLIPDYWLVTSSHSGDCCYYSQPCSLLALPVSLEESLIFTLWITLTLFRLSNITDLSLVFSVSWHWHSVSWFVETSPALITFLFLNDKIQSIWTNPQSFLSISG